MQQRRKMAKHATSLPAHDSCLDTGGGAVMERGGGERGGRKVVARLLVSSPGQALTAGRYAAGRRRWHRLRIPAN